MGLLISACTDAALWLANRSIDEESMNIHRDLSYGEHTRQSLDLYLPKSANSPTPLIAFFYGGGWSMGEKSQYQFVANRLIAEGYAVAIVDYRLYPEVRYPAFIEDTSSAIQWLHGQADRYGYQQDAIFAMGHSAGAYNIMMAAAKESLPVKGLIGISGPYAFTPKIRKYKSIFSEAKPIESMHVTGHINVSMPASLIVHGESDGLVNSRNSQALYDAINNANGQSELKFYEAGHYGIIVPFVSWRGSSLSLVEDVNAFIQSQLADANG